MTAPQTPAVQGRYHIVYSLHLLKKGLFFCLVPLVQALISWDLPSLYGVLRQEALILLALAAVSLVLWRNTGWRQYPERLELYSGVLLHRSRVLRRSELAVVEITRNPFLQLLGAARVTLYGCRVRQTITLYLPRRAAMALADTLLPPPRKPPLFKPVGGQRLAFVMVSANVISTALLLMVSLRQTEELLGAAVTLPIRDNFTRLEQLVEKVVPAGVAWLFTAVFLLWGASLLVSLLRTVGFTVARSGGVILCHGGFILRTERRILAAAVSACDVRITPVARLLRRYPVYLTAGSYHAGDVPILVCKKGQTDLLQALMPGFVPPGGPTENRIGRSVPMFFWKSGACLAFSLALLGVSMWQLPAVTGLLVIPCVLSAAAVLISAEGYRLEGAARTPGRVLTVQYSRIFTRHCVCVFTPDINFRLFASPFAQSVGRCNLTIQLPCGFRMRVRSVNRYRAAHLPLEM
ncbi:MAG TPA: PH domain-containing protein [Candidatus Gemmiger avium]|nr:PH domain-containing protein [Candidatus Gemmiger avium]